VAHDADRGPQDHGEQPAEHEDQPERAGKITEPASPKDQEQDGRARDGHQRQLAAEPPAAPRWDCQARHATHLPTGCRVRREAIWSVVSDQLIGGWAMLPVRCRQGSPGRAEDRPDLKQPNGHLRALVELCVHRLVAHPAAVLPLRRDQPLHDSRAGAR
jgi:hypothetical protein